jgi:hypothetical protein
MPSPRPSAARSCLRRVEGRGGEGRGWWEGGEGGRGEREGGVGDR